MTHHSRERYAPARNGVKRVTGKLSDRLDDIEARRQELGEAIVAMRAEVDAIEGGEPEPPKPRQAAPAGRGKRRRQRHASATESASIDDSRVTPHAERVHYPWDRAFTAAMQAARTIDVYGHLGLDDEHTPAAERGAAIDAALVAYVEAGKARDRVAAVPLLMRDARLAGEQAP